MNVFVKSDEIEKQIDFDKDFYFAISKIRFHLSYLTHQLSFGNKVLIEK